ncbi:FAD-dependent oxidoreductase [Hydrogenophaga sp. PBL-H3]|uniref:FAD-dependent oxidoreductase n=1 Tax=Hydrogenophaga sp. PBL-H3 TaxID=434010 RepID=UPI00131F8CC5|nr:FAD-dependent oxidoreductase [Hydrogenophaga sp. PBL-H3]QHE75332.1 FAD-dependent oxidoreductase [Hydrogenophaga sp. PBL-H3]QHE79759.1 FAD-dependent oxidoreductase [Hydrogenophaga sp. PBL-H3]
MTTYRETALTNSYEFTAGAGYELPEYPFVEPPELHATTPVRHPVVIVGGGITGLTLACSLARLGVRAVLIDEDNTVGVKGASSRGICYTQKSLEIFERLGIFERIAAKGVQWSVGRTFAGDDEVYSFDLRQQGQYHLSQQPPFINIQQFYIEGFLVERIQELGPVDLRWQNRLTGFEQNADFATLTIETPAGTYRLEAEHVIDATGSHSPLRKWLNVPFDSRRGDDRWCIADVRFSTHPPQERHTWIEAPFNENRAVWQHLMADDVWRIDYQMAPNADPEYVSREDVVRERLARQFGPDVQVEIVWVGPYAYRSECVHAMRHGRVFLMGDSAKVVSPFGARGGNTGVADADNLAWKLAAVLGGKADATLLESYNDERLDAARQNVCVTNRTARFLRPADGTERLFRQAAIGLAKQHPFARALINTGRMAVANPYARSRACTYAAASAAGQSVQNVGFEWADGAQGDVNDLLNWAGGDLLVLVFGDLPAAALQRLRRLCLDAPVRSVQVLGTNGAAQALEHVRDPQGHLRGACHVLGQEPDHAWALVRPDGYLAATGETINAQLVAAIERSLGLRGNQP